MYFETKEDESQSLVEVPMEVNKWRKDTKVIYSREIFLDINSPFTERRVPFTMNFFE